MHKNTVLISIVALLAGFIAGFLLANNLNGSEIALLRSQIGQRQPANSASQQPDQFSLSEEEIRAKIDEADRNPGDFAFQKDIGIAFYRYAATTQNLPLFEQSIRILERASALNPNDFDVLVALGNGYFDIGFAKKERASFEKSREIYAKALAVKPGDIEVQTDIGISYFVQEPQDLAKAAAELQKVVDSNPRHTRSMQFLAEVYIRQNRLPEAEKMLAKVKEIEPANPAVRQLTTLLENARAGAVK
jgi:tetratricopeptide (TPR) repeat protein